MAALSTQSSTSASWEAFKIAFTHIDTLPYKTRKIYESWTYAATRRHGAVFLDANHVFLVGGRFLQVRATVPEARYQLTRQGRISSRACWRSIC